MLTPNYTVAIPAQADPLIDTDAEIETERILRPLRTRRATPVRNGPKVVITSEPSRADRGRDRKSTRKGAGPRCSAGADLRSTPTRIA